MCSLDDRNVGNVEQDGQEKGPGLPPGRTFEENQEAPQRPLEPQNAQLKSIEEQEQHDVPLQEAVKQGTRSSAIYRLRQGSSRAAAIAVLAPSSPSSSLNDGSRLSQITIISQFCKLSDVVLPLLHAGRLKEETTMPLLLLNAMELLIPYLAGLRNPSSVLSSEERATEETLFSEASRELSAALGREGGGSCELVASAAILGTWALFRGLGKVAKGMLLAARVFGWHAGIFESPSSFSAPASRLCWEDLASKIYGDDWKERPMSLPELKGIRELWIDSWTTERLAWTVFRLGRLVVGDRAGAAAPAAPIPEPEPDPCKIVGRHSHPMPGVWNTSFSLFFDPRLVPPVRPLSDYIAWIGRPRYDPLRQSNLALLGSSILKIRTLLEAVNYALRFRVDTFLTACKQAGLGSPFELPLVPPVPFIREAAPAIQQLLIQRASLDADILDAWNVFPECLKTAMATGEAKPAIEEMAEAARDFNFAFNRLPLMCAIPLLRLELCTSFGNPLTSTNGHATLSETLGNEFGTTGGYEQMLGDAIAYTRVLASWITLNPQLDCHISGGSIIFRVLCRHVASVRYLRSSAASSSSLGNFSHSHLTIVIQEVDRDVIICLEMLERFARKGSWMVPLYNVAKKLVDGTRITDLELEMAKMRIDLPQDGYCWEGPISK